MIHGVRLEGGRAVSYRNRWVRTRSFTDGARTYDDQGHRDLAAGPANTPTSSGTGRTLVLVETTLPYELTRDLDTVGAHDFDQTIFKDAIQAPRLGRVTRRAAARASPAR